MKRRGTLALACVVAIVAAGAIGFWIGRTTGDTEAPDPRTQARARLLVAELDRLRSFTLAAIDDACWWPRDYRLKLPVAERQALAAELPARDWTLVANTLTIAEEIPMRRRDGFEWRPGIESNDMDLSLAFLRTAAPAVKALAKVANLPAQPTPELSSRPREYNRTGMVPDTRRGWDRPSPLCRE